LWRRPRPKLGCEAKERRKKKKKKKKNESSTTIKHSLITLISSMVFSFLGIISVILYEAMVASLALLIGLGNIA
jgi:ABC-type phosphate transport system permease subunit